MFEPILTPRLRLRPVVASDAASLAERRSEPTAAALQSWEAPFPVAAAERLIAGAMAHDEPPVDDWWMLTIERLDDGAVIGDLAIHLTWAGRCVEIGYTLAFEAWGHGFASEAAAALVARLLERPELTRVAASLHPDNHRSARVLENIGFRYEGRTKLSYWVGDENTDDLLYGMTRDDHADWVARPLGAPTEVGLVEVTPDNQRAVLSLTTHESQRRFVSPNVKSLADAQVPEIIDGMEEEGLSHIDVTQDAERGWADEVNMVAEHSLHKFAGSWYNGKNIEGKPGGFMIYVGGFPRFAELCDQAVSEDYAGFIRR